MAKINAGKVSDMPPNSITKLENADVSVANVNGEFYAITDTCTHAGASMANGKIDGENIICGWHAASFECKSGKLAKFPAKIEDLKSDKVQFPFMLHTAPFLKAENLTEQILQVFGVKCIDFDDLV